MKKQRQVLLLIILSICILNPAYSQSRDKKGKTQSSGKTGEKKAKKGFTVKWGSDMKLKGGFPTDMLLYDKEKGSFYVTCIIPKFAGRGDFNIAKIDEKLDLVEQKRIQTVEENKKATYNREIAFLDFGGEIYVIEEEKVAKEKKVNYYFETIDKNTLEPANDKKLVYTVDYSVNKNRDDDIVNFMADDNDKFIIVYDQHFVDKKDNAQVTITALNKSFDKVWSKDITLPIVATRSGTTDFSKYIDGDGNLYLVVKAYKEAKKKAKEVKDGELNYDFHIYMIGENIKEFIDYPFQLKDKAVSQVKLNVSKKGELIATGIYADINTDKDKISMPKGIFYTTIDPENKKILTQSYKEFSSEVYTAGLKARQAEKVEKKLEKGKDAAGYTFLIRDLIPRTDGGSTMIAEEYSMVIIRTYNGKTTHTTIIYTYQNIIVSKISAAGEVEWISVIPKKQVTENTYYPSSFLLFDHKNDTYHIFFNDHRDNLSAARSKEDGLKIMSNVKKAVLVSVEVGADGSISKKAEVVKLPPDDEKTHFYPLYSFIPENDKDIILYGTEKSKEKFARIQFDNK